MLILVLILIPMAAQDDSHVGNTSPLLSPDPKTAASLINQVDVLQEWDDENEEFTGPNYKQADDDYFSSVQDTLNEINRDAFGSKGEEDAIEAMLKNLLLDNNINSDAPKDFLYDTMLSKLLGRELLHAPLLDLHNEVKRSYLIPSIVPQMANRTQKGMSNPILSACGK